VGGRGEGDCEDGVDEGCVFHFDGGGGGVVRFLMEKVVPMTMLPISWIAMPSFELHVMQNIFSISTLTSSVLLREEVLLNSWLCLL
jgi:hypothetical protein